MVADLEGRDHGSGGDFKGLHHKSPDEQGEENRDDKGLGIFPKGGFFTRLGAII